MRRLAGLLATALLAAVFVSGTLGISSGAAGPAVTPQEKAQARQALLVLSDFPKGWKSSPGLSAGSGPSLAPDVQMARCLGVAPASIEFNPPEVVSPGFGDEPGNLFAANTIEIYRSSTSAHNVYAALSRTDAAGCLNALIAAQRSPGTTSQASYRKLASPKGTVVFGLSSSGAGVGTVEGSLVVAYFTHKQFGDSILIGSVGSATSIDTLAQRLLAVARSRL